MSPYQRRIDTLKVLLTGSVVAGTNTYTSVENELTAAATTVRVPQLPRRRILQVLHTTRSLDSVLRAFVQHHGVTCNKPTLGGYLTALSQNAGHPSLAILPPLRKTHFQASIVASRNRYMHEADAFPATDGETMTLVSEMHTCLSEVFAL